MESHAVCEPRTSKIYDHFQFVPFVSASGDSCDLSNNSTNENISLCNLSGEEASAFYNDVISSPPTSLPSSAESTRKHQTVRKKSSSSFSNSRHTIFRYAQEGNLEGIKHFLSRQCHVDVQDMYGWTPLMCAAFEGHYAVAEFLIENGARIDKKNEQGLTSLDIALNKNHGALITLFRHGTVGKTETPEVEIKKQIRYCNLCDCSYEGTPSFHEKSIVHLFSSKRKNTSTYYFIPENNRGFQIMLKKGWDKNYGLGVNANGRKFPVKTVLKTDRMCIGGKQEVPKVTHFGPNDYQSVKVAHQPASNLKKESKIKKRKMKKLENKNRQLEIEYRRQFHLE